MVLPETALSMSDRSAITSIYSLPPSPAPGAPGGHTLSLRGGSSMIYVRSRRSIVTLGALSLLCLVVFGLLALLATRLPEGWVADVPLGVGVLGAAVAITWAAFQLHGWPSSKLGFFRDRIVVVHGRHEMRAMWEL